MSVSWNSGVAEVSPLATNGTGRLTSTKGIKSRHIREAEQSRLSLHRLRCVAPRDLLTSLGTVISAGAEVGGEGIVRDLSAKWRLAQASEIAALPARMSARMIILATIK